jgi:hypothetical protein
MRKILFNVPGVKRLLQPEVCSSSCANLKARAGPAQSVQQPEYVTPHEQIKNLCTLLRVNVLCNWKL